EVLASTTAEPSGDWVAVPERLLPPGGAEITVGIAGQPPAPEQAFVVVIDEDRQAEPLIVATAPGEASQVLQGLPPPAADADAPEPAAAAAPEQPVDQSAAAEAVPAPASGLQVATAPEPQLVPPPAPPAPALVTSPEPDAAAARATAPSGAAESAQPVVAADPGVSEEPPP